MNEVSQFQKAAELLAVNGNDFYEQNMLYLCSFYVQVSINK